jgi:hypothetical protein
MELGKVAGLVDDKHVGLELACRGFAQAAALALAATSLPYTWEGLCCPVGIL